MNKSIKIAKDFSKYTGLRHASISDNSGEEFYHKILNKEFHDALINNYTLTVDLDGAAAYSPSFIDEAFGNLIYDFSLDLVKKHLTVISNIEPHWIYMLENETFPQWQSRREKNEVPKTTINHKDWYRMNSVNGKIELNQWTA